MSWPAAPSTVQAIGSSTFNPPPFDAPFGLHEIYDFHLEYSSSHPLFIWHSSSLGLQSLTWGEVARGTHRAAYYITKHAQTPVGNGDAPPVVAVLAFTDTVTSVCVMLGVIRAGYQCFCISPRNSVTGVRHLLQVVGASELVVHNDGPLRVLAATAMAELKTPVHVIPLPGFRDIFPTDPSTFQPFTSRPLKGLDTPAIIMHSSGSTSFPKPRTFNHRFLVQQSHVPWFGQTDLCNEVLAMHAVPMFHAQGLFNTLLPVHSTFRVFSVTFHSNIVYAIKTSTGLILSIFPPDVPTSIPAPEKLIQGLVATNSTILITVPSFLEYWAESVKYVEALSRLKAIFCGGAPLNKDSTTIYRESHAQIICYLAATEYGIATMLIPKHAPSEGSEWFAISPHLSPVFIPQEEPNTFELIFPVSPIYTPAVVNTKVDGCDAYATGDLVTQHPLNRNLWKVHGRVDDQIMLSTGEKTNPGPIEAIIASNPYIKTCVMFGRGRFQNGILIEPTNPFNPSDMEALSTFRSVIWPAVEEANRFAPSHSRIFKEMIIVSHPSKPFEPTLKNTPKRQLVIATYREEIDTAYAAVAESTQQEIPPPVVWDLKQTLAFVRKVVSEVLIAEESRLRDDDDIFSRGADSLQATWIRNSILRALRESSNQSVAKELPPSFVYDHPAITALAHYLVDAVTGRTDTDVAAVSNMAQKIKQMEDLVVKYTTNFPGRPGMESNQTTDMSSDEVVVLTGSTGSLGSQILASLVRDPGVARIYALNRRGVVPVLQRQGKVWEDHDLNPLLLRSNKIIFVEFDATEGLGISKDVYDNIRTSATLIIHNAWTVDFNLTLSSFEPNIRVLRSLMDLALRSNRVHPPHFVFTSTVGVVRNWAGPCAVPEAPLSDMALAVGAGYTESKCVAEHILGTPNTGLRTIVVRVGQLSGAPNGSWRTTEWVPALVKSGTTLGVLPHVEGAVSWIPLHAAASGLIEVARTESVTPGITFVHLVHPRPVPWNTIFRPISEMLGVPLVPYNQWLERLQASAASSIQEPAVKLLGFFAAVILEGGGRGDAMGFPTLESTGIKKRAPKTMRTVDALGQEDVTKWIQHWKRKGFLSV